MQDLEAELKDERGRLRALTTEQTKALREKEVARLDLERADDVSNVSGRIFHAYHLIFCAGHKRHPCAAPAPEEGEPRP